jgi:UV DNA damage endonuclease
MDYSTELKPAQVSPVPNKLIGFACKLSRLDSKKGVVSVPEFNTASTTVAWLNRQTKSVAEQKLWAIAQHNCQSVINLIREVGSWDPHLRMVRISSDILPVYTEPTWRYYWQSQEVRDYLSAQFAQAGQLARTAGVKLSFHPGQFCCIVSDRDDVVLRSVEELEYHTDIAKWMGYGKTKLDFKINVHLSGRRQAAGFEQAWQLMSPELRNCLTLENDEYQASLNDLIPLKKYVGIVLDIHHHLIHDEEYIQADDDRIKHVIESWQGQRPTMHYSQSSEEWIGHLGDCCPTMEVMLESTNKSKLRAHSNFYPNRAVNRWALSHWQWGDIMSECKSKNLGSLQLYTQAKEENLCN